MDEEINAALAGIGARLRAIRTDRGMTLRDLAEATDISESTLSRLEAGQRRPNLDLILPLARALSVNLDAIVDSPVTGDPRVDLRPYQAWGRTIIPLSRHAVGVTAVKQIIPAQDKPETPIRQRHDGYEWVYVLSGRLRLIVADNDVIIGPGQAAEFDTRHPHWTGSADGEPVEYLCLLNEQGERLHLGRGRASAGAPMMDPE
jgi:transcriptional regulator with XRE-family HTH domain